MEKVYGERWWNKKNRMVKEMSENEARTIHESNGCYCMALLEDSVAKYVIDFSSKHVIVRFYEDGLCLSYDFVKTQEKLFLKAAFYYKRDEGKVTEMMTFNFSESGNLYMSKQNMILNETEERESIVDVTPNWEEIPDFGYYENLIKKER